MANLARQLQGYRLTTAEITYHMPDHPELLQVFLWQEYDMAPRFPRLERFLAYWEANLDGALHSVRMASAPLLSHSPHRHLGADHIIH